MTVFVKPHSHVRLLGAVFSLQVFGFFFPSMPKSPSSTNFQHCLIHSILFCQQGLRGCILKTQGMISSP